MLLDPYERLTLNPFHNKPMKTSERIFSSMLRTKQESTLPVVRTFTFCAHHSTTLARIPLNNPLSACPHDGCPASFPHEGAVLPYSSILAVTMPCTPLALARTPARPSSVIDDNHLGVICSACARRTYTYTVCRATCAAAAVPARARRSSKYKLRV